MTNLKAIIGSATLCTAAITLLTSYAYKKGIKDGFVGGAALAGMAFNSLNNKKDGKEEES